jgi:alkylated DNA repair dioxygenase AlkB
MVRSGQQTKLFDLGQELPNGFIYRPDFLTEEEEELLLAYIENLPLAHPSTRDHEAKRRIMSFGWGFNFKENKLIPGPALPRFLHRTQRKIAKWLDIAPARVAEALITEYTPGSAIGWHVDNESFEKIVGISLAGWCRMRLRPLYGIRNNPDALVGAATASRRGKESVISIEVEPRSAYIMQGNARWQWQHSVAAVETLRYSITFRTLPTTALRR